MHNPLYIIIRFYRLNDLRWLTHPKKLVTPRMICQGWSSRFYPQNSLLSNSALLTKTGIMMRTLWAGDDRMLMREIRALAKAIIVIGLCVTAFA